MLALPTKYALKALSILNRENPEFFTQVKILSQKADVPGPYLSKIMKALVAKRLLESRKGVAGGVRFPPGRKSISFYDVCVALDDPLVSQTCFLSKHPCNSGKPCPMHESWGGLQRQVVNLLKRSVFRMM